MGYRLEDGSDELLKECLEQKRFNPFCKVIDHCGDCPAEEECCYLPKISSKDKEKRYVVRVLTEAIEKRKRL